MTARAAQALGLGCVRAGTAGGTGAGGAGGGRGGAGTPGCVVDITLRTACGARQRLGRLYSVICELASGL